MIDAARDALAALQTRLHARNDPAREDEYAYRLFFAEPYPSLLAVSYFGDAFDEPFADFLTTLARPEVAPHLRIVEVDGPDEGANGTRPWDIGPLVAGGARYESLRTLRLPLTDAVHHNRTTLTRGDYYEENGAGAALLDACPNLQELSLASAPGAAFFEREAHPLGWLTVQVGYDLQEFVTNLARSTCFPNLHTLDFTDYSEDCYPARCTPFVQFEALVVAPGLPNLRSVILRNARLDDEQFTRLSALAKAHRRTVMRFTELEAAR